MGFHENAKFPTVAEYGSQGGPGGNVSVTRLRSGSEERNNPWSKQLHRYDISLEYKTREQAVAIRRFYNLRGGLQNGFRFEDPEDHNSTDIGYNADQGPSGQNPSSTDVEVGVGDGSTTEFQLVKKYDDGTNPVITRTINKPVSGTVLVSVDEVTKTEGVDYSINYVTGVITFDTAPGVGLSVQAGFEFDVPVRYGEEINSWFPHTSASFDSGGIATCTLVELSDPPYADDEWWPGGSNTFDFAVDTQLSLLEGKLKIATCTSAGANLILPPLTELLANGQYFKIWCEASSEDFDVVDSDGSTVIASLTASSNTWLHIITNTAGVRVWRSE